MVRRSSPQKDMKKRIAILTLSAMFFALGFAAEAQQPKKIPRIGYLTGTREPTCDAPDANRDAFRQARLPSAFFSCRSL
jgi:hypothetical protein